MASRGVAEVLAEVHRALDRLDEGLWSDAEAVELAAGIQGVRARTEAMACRSAAWLQSRSAGPEERLVSAAGWARRHTTADPKVVAGDARLGLWLEAFDGFGDAFGRGVLTRAHVQVLRRVDNPRTAADLMAHQDWLIQQAQQLGFVEFCTMLRSWELAADPDGAEPSAQVARRYLTLTTAVDGTVRGSLLLDPLAGHALVTAVGRECERLRRQELDDPNTGRTVAQRRADALVGLATGTSTAGAAPLVHVVLSEHVADDQLAQSLGKGALRLPLHHEHPDGRSELIDGTPLHPRFAMAALMTGVLRRVVMGADSEILDLGRSVRCFPRHLRDAMLVAARGRCQQDGCDAPLAWLQADHLIPWTLGGPTAIRNGRICCQPHDHLKGATPPAPEQPP